MQVYFFTAGIDSDELNELEGRIRITLPNLRKIAKLDEVTRQLAQNGTTAVNEQSYIIFPVLTATSFDRILDITEQGHPGIFFIFISKEISASDYKRLVRGGGADWVSMQGAPQEILDIVSGTNRRGARATPEKQARPVMVALVPSIGGVGNGTLAIETAVQIKLNKQTQRRRICLLDLDLQFSHVCEYIDIEPRLQSQEITQNPDRLDARLFELFISRHAATGIDVLAQPRNRRAPAEVNMAALDVLFREISPRYDLVIIDLPAPWFDWTDQILSVCDLAIIIGLNNVPGLRQIAETLQTVKSAPHIPPQIVVALNRCESGLTGGIARRRDVDRVLGRQTVVYIRADAAAANHSINTGVPISITSPSSRITKDIRALASLVSALTPARAQVVGVTK
jgi:Flp pilus assembly CpaE family ATPase